MNPAVLDIESSALFVRFNERSHFGDKDMTAYESLIKMLQWWPHQCLKDLCQVCGIHRPIRAKSFSNSYDYTLIILVPLILILHVTSLNLVKTAILGMKLKHGFSQPQDLRLMIWQNLGKLVSKETASPRSYLLPKSGKQVFWHWG